MYGFGGDPKVQDIPSSFLKTHRFIHEVNCIRRNGVVEIFLSA